MFKIIYVLLLCCDLGVHVTVEWLERCGVRFSDSRYRSPKCPDRFFGPPSLLFSRVKATGVWRWPFTSIYYQV